MKSTDVLVIGGSAAGMVVALSGKGAYPDKRFTMVKKQDVVMVPCGIPYIFGTLAGSEQNIMPVDKMMSQAGVESVVGEVVSIDIPKKVATFADGSTIGFDKLVLATGSTPILPKWLEGREKENVFVVPKEKEYLDQMKAKLSACKHVVVVGAGFIGVELSDEFKKTGGHVTLIEKLPHILALAFDVELSDKMTTLLQQRGIEVKTGVGVAKIGGETKVESVTLDNGDVIPADAVVVSRGRLRTKTGFRHAPPRAHDAGFHRLCRSSNRRPQSLSIAYRQNLLRDHRHLRHRHRRRGIRHRRIDRGTSQSRTNRCRDRHIRRYRPPPWHPPRRSNSLPPETPASSSAVKSSVGRARAN